MPPDEYLQMLSHLHRSLFGLGLRLRPRAHWAGDRRRNEIVASNIADLADQQIDIWTRKTHDKSAILDVFSHLNRSYLSVFVLNVEKGRIRIVDKPPFMVPPHERAQVLSMMKGFPTRIRFYKTFLEHVMTTSGIDSSMTIAVDVNDIGLDSASAPLFAFQKRTGSANILLPDIDFFYNGWYRRPRDVIAYDDKRIVAGFVGSSTGGAIDVDTIKEGRNPRLRAAAYFVGSQNADFRIAKAVQVRDAAAKALLESQPYFSRQIGWRAQFRNRFLVSMDGNGAACSRLAIGLKSQSAVIKYESPFSLFYFPKMTPGRDYISVSSEADVERVVETERANPGAHRAVAEAGQEFFSRYLQRDRVITYTAALLRKYADLYAAM